MDSFSIACTTCQTQLRVRDRSAIGQILTCPKCGSMVLVEPPADSSAATTGSGRTGPPPLPKPPATNSGVTDSQPGPANLSDTVEDPTLYGLADESLEDAWAGADTASPVSAATEPLAEPILPTEDWVTPSSAAWRPWLLRGCMVVAGIGLAIAVFGWLSRDQGGPPPSAPAVAQPDGPSRNLPAAATDAEPAEAAHDDDASPAEDAPPAVTPPELPALPKPAAVSAPPIGEVVDAEPVPPPVDKLEEAVANPAGEKEASPPGFVAAKETGETESVASAAALRETLKAFGAILDEPEPAAEDAAPRDAPTGTPMEAESGARLDRPRPLDIDVEARLADRIQQIDFNDVPLTGLLDFISEFSTIPITLDPEVLPYLRITPDTPLTVRQSDTTVAALLGESLKKVGLGYAIQENQLFVTRTEAGAPLVRTVPFNLSDIAAGDGGQIETISRLIRELIAPDSWKDAGGQGTIQVQEQSLLVEHEETILYEVLGFCEKLRVARGLAPRGKLDPALFELTPRSQRAAAALQTPVSVNFIRPERFSLIVSRIAKESGTHVLIDWRSAAQMGWNPDAQRSFTSGGKSLAETLQALLQPMELAYRIVDRNTLQITSQPALEEHVELEFYPVSALLGAERTADQLLDAIQSHLGEGALRDQGGLGTLRYDAPSKHLLAALPQPMQQSVAKFLAELKAGEKKL